MPSQGQWPVHIPDTDFNLVLYSCCIFPALLNMYPGEGASHTHTHFCPISWMFSIPPVPCSLPDHSVQVLVLQMTCQTHFGSKLAASLSAATIWVAGSVVPCFDLPLSQRIVSSHSIVLSQCGRSKVPTAQLHHPAAYTFFICIWHTLQSPLLWCTVYSQNFPLTSLPVSQYIVHKMRRLAGA